MNISHWVRALANYLHGPTPSVKSAFGTAISEEIEFHLSERMRNYMEQGFSAAEARKAAIDRFGSTSHVAAECYAVAATDLVVWHRLHQLLTAGLIVAVVALGVAVGRISRATASALVLPPPIATMVDNDWTGDVTGSVRDELGRPLAGADVLIVVKTWPDQSYFQRAYPVRTSADGRFSISDVYPTNDQYCVQIAAVTEQHVLESSYYQKQGGMLEPIDFELPPAAFVAVRITGEAGEPLSGVEVFPHQRMTLDGNDHQVYFDSATSITRRTNTAGLVELPYFRAGETATIYVLPPHGEWEVHEFLVPQLGEIVSVPTNAPAAHHNEET